jgi:hypothetical protein
MSAFPNSGHEMAIRDLRSLSVALEPKMSALPPKADMKWQFTNLWNLSVRFGAKNVRFAPKSRHWMTVLECPLWARSGHRPQLRFMEIANLCEAKMVPGWRGE